MNYRVEAYTPEKKSFWNQCVRTARQASFLFERDFMDYHADRFHDVSLFVFNHKDEVLALLPANVSRVDAACIESHGGLTYGGLLLMPNATTAIVGECLKVCTDYYKEHGYISMLYKPLPYIYHVYPADEDLYWLFRFGAVMQARTVSSVIDLKRAYAFNSLRRRKVRKAENQGTLHLHEGIAYLHDYWQVLQGVLQERHHTNPVHTYDEMRKLMLSFPDRITLHVVTAGHSCQQADRADEGRVVAGCILFHLPRVVHVQYIAASNEGRECCALDWLFARIIGTAKGNADNVPYFDFGISTENGGTYLNEGLIFQKEGFGARAVCYDVYRLNFGTSDVSDHGATR